MKKKIKILFLVILIFIISLIIVELFVLPFGLKGEYRSWQWYRGCHFEMGCTPEAIRINLYKNYFISIIFLITLFIGYLILLKKKIGKKILILIFIIWCLALYTQIPSRFHTFLFEKIINRDIYLEPSKIEWTLIDEDDNGKYEKLRAEIFLPLSEFNDEQLDYYRIYEEEGCFWLEAEKEIKDQLIDYYYHPLIARSCKRYPAEKGFLIDKKNNKIIIDFRPYNDYKIEDFYYIKNGFIYNSMPVNLQDYRYFFFKTEDFKSPKYSYKIFDEYK